jgi:hypothetical protein
LRQQFLFSLVGIVDSGTEAVIAYMLKLRPNGQNCRKLATMPNHTRSTTATHHLPREWANLNTMRLLGMETFNHASY